MNGSRLPNRGVHTINENELMYSIKIVIKYLSTLAKIQHPSATRIRKIIPHPTENNWLISTSHGNNEVSVWNIETGHRQAALWASNAPPLSKESVIHPHHSHLI